MNKRLRNITAVFLAVIMVVLVIPVTSVTVSAGSVIEAAISWAINIANDDSHLYSQSVRWGPSYDCSSFVISAFNNAGVDTGNATYTGNMRNNFIEHGFTWIPWSQIGGVGNLVRGDVLLNEANHTEIYIGNSQMVGAHSSKYAAANQISVVGYSNSSNWDGVLRYNDESIPDPEVESWYYHGATDHSDFRPVISVKNPETVSTVKFAVRYDTTDWKWYDGEYNGGNAWFCDVLSSDIGVGNYIICHAYIYGKNGSSKGYPFIELTLGKDAEPSVQTWYYDGATDHSDFRPVIRFDNPETVSTVKFAVRYDTGEWKWYDGEYNGGNAWYCDVLSNDLGSGSYILCHSYVYAKNGSNKGYPFVDLKLDKDYDDPSIKGWDYVYYSEKKELCYSIEIDNPETVSNIQFAVRTNNTDWEWFDSVYNGNSAWNLSINADSYQRGEILYCHCYVSGKNGFYKGYPYIEYDLGLSIGDSNGDGNVDVLDAATIQKFASGMADMTNDQQYFADVNNDGVVDILDAADVQKFAAGIITEFKKKG